MFQDLLVRLDRSLSSRDLEDVASVLLRNPGLDLGYIRKWLKRFADGTEGDFLAIFEGVLQALPEKGR